MKCSKCKGKVGPWIGIEATAKAWKEDEAILIDVRELRALLCLDCARVFRSWLTTPRTGMTEGG